MIVLGLKRVLTGQSTGHPPAFHMDKFAPLFGISVYAFMCHHSLPAVVTPMRSVDFFKLKFTKFYFQTKISYPPTISHGLPVDIGLLSVVIDERCVRVRESSRCVHVAISKRFHRYKNVVKFFNFK
jgi:hypothetical protein